MASVSASHIILNRPNQKGASDHSGNQAQDLLTSSLTLYRLSYRAPGEQVYK